MTIHSLALPDYAWKRRAHPRCGRWSGKKVLATCAILFGVILAPVSFAGRYGIPAFGGYYHFGEAILWIAVGLALWKGDLDRLRRTVGGFLVFHGVAQIGFGFWSVAREFSSLRVVELASFVVIGYGVLSAKEWGRRGCIVLGLTSYGWSLANLALGYQLSLGEPPLGPLRWTIVFVGILVPLVTGPSLALAFYGAHSSTRSGFAEARRKPKGCCAADHRRQT